MANFKLVYVDAKPMRLKGKKIFAGLAVTSNGSIKPGQYRSVLTNELISITSSGGNVLLEEGKPYGTNPPTPVTIDADLSNPRLDDIYTDSSNVAWLDTIIDDVGFADDEWMPVTVGDSLGMRGEGWIRLEGGKIRLQAFSEAAQPLVPPLNVRKAAFA